MEEVEKKKGKWSEYVAGGVEFPDYMVTPQPPEPKKPTPFQHVINGFKKKVEEQTVKLKSKPTDEKLEELDLASGYEEVVQASGYYTHPYSDGDPDKYLDSVRDGNARLEKNGILRKKRR